MSRSSPLSNRQARQARKAIPKAVRQTKAVQPPAEPVIHKAGTVAAVSALKDQLAERVARQTGVDLKTAMKSVVAYRVDDLVVVDLKAQTVRPATALRVKGDDGILALHGTGSLSDDLAKAALAYRLLFEQGGRSLGSHLGSAGEGRRVRDWSELAIVKDPETESGLAVLRSAMDLHRAYVSARLSQIEREVGLAMVDGRELKALQEIAGEGRSVRELAGGGGRKATVWRDALVRALEVVARVLRITER